MDPAMSFKCPVRAVLLDVDGTLYHQQVLRGFMALELLALPCTALSYRAASHIWRTLRLFRHVREEMRLRGAPEDSLALLQYAHAATRSGREATAVERIVTEWMYQRPLKYLKLCRRRGVEAFFGFLQREHIHIGVFSDYPVIDKLHALGLAPAVSLTLCATDPDINAFKPHPKGFLRACALWGVPPEQVLYVGDRPEVDAVGAAAAGMPCAILRQGVRRRGQETAASTYSTFPSFMRLQQGLTPGC
jgi:HAD superfamily hydrolase (TIGR01549 family)